MLFIGILRKPLFVFNCFKPSEISLIMNKSNATITRERRILLKKLFDVDGDAVEFDVRIKDLL